MGGEETGAHGFMNGHCYVYVWVMVMVMVMLMLMRMLMVMVMVMNTKANLHTTPDNATITDETVDLGIHHLISEFCLNIRKPMKNMISNSSPIFDQSIDRHQDDSPDLA